MTGSVNRIWIAYGLLLALLAVTLAGALLLVPQNCWDARFCLSTGTLLFAEAQLVFVVVLPRARGTAPWSAAQITVSFFYLLAVVYLAWFGLSDVSLKGLAVWHLAAFFGLLLGLGTTVMASGHTRDSRVALAQGRVWLQGWTSRYASLCDRVVPSASPEITSLNRALAGFRDDLRYADRDSIPGVEAIECELDAALDGLAVPLEALQAAVAAQDAERISAMAGDGRARLEIIRKAFDRRAATLKALR